MKKKNTKRIITITACMYLLVYNKVCHTSAYRPVTGAPYHTSNELRLGMLTPIRSVLILYPHGTSTGSSIEMVNLGPRV